MRKNVIIAGVFVVGLALGLVYAQLSQNTIDAFLASPVGRAFMETYGALQSDYLEGVDNEKVVRGAINGMIEALDDPYTHYLEPKAADRDREDRTGSFGGIGATLSAINRKDQTIVEIVNVYKDSPAWNAGLQRGDIFIEVDGENVEETPIDDVVEKVRGPEGSTVNLKMKRAGADNLLEFNIVRGTIEIISVESTVLPNNVGYVTISTFANQRVFDQLDEQLKNLKEQGIESLILDLRDNGGGLLNQGILVADEFLSSGDIVFQRSRGVTTRLAAADPTYFDLPMVVLVNKNSASASEIVAGALQDNNRALVVGEETFGKGVGQTVSPLSDGGQLVLLNFEWLTPNRQSINQKGITPNVEVVDTRRPGFLTLEGQGAEPGQEIEILVNGESIGKADINEDGSFDFFQTIERPDVSAVQGEALVDLNNDSALKTAYDTLLEQIAKN
ncbi:MAG: S41 family peptidase [Trueperaceae bacterium]|nr:S41 family peptidase [Trueperaceae bacterium]